MLINFTETEEYNTKLDIELSLDVTLNEDNWGIDEWGDEHLVLCSLRQSETMPLI